MLHQNRQRILRICRVHARTPQDQEDLYQEVLCQIWRALPGLREKAHVNTWLYRVTLNTAISYVRKSAAERRATETGGDEFKIQAGEWEPAAAPNPRREQLYEAIARLNELEKAVVTMFLDDLSYDEIGRVMNIDTSHVGVLLHRAKKKLSALMKETLE